MPDYTDPRTLALLRELERLGLSDQAFSLLHHFEEPTTIASHRSYCELLAEDGARFRTKNNPLVQRRLEMVLAMYRTARFKNPAAFEHLARAAITELPPDPRPLREQLA